MSNLTSPKSKTSNRVLGLDLARALAIFGMVVVNFKLVMEAETGSAILLGFGALFEGRASALFVILAGIGVTLMTSRAMSDVDSSQHQKARRSILKRGLLLFIIGLLYTPIWEADILHFYGVYFFVAACLLGMTNKALLAVASCFVALFPLVMLVFDYNQNWQWETLTYLNLWTLDGLFRHILFNGYHPVIPWVSFLIFGMWLGRHDLNDARLRRRLFWSGLIVCAAIESALFALRQLPPQALGLTKLEAQELLVSSILPPLPHYMLSATGSAVSVLVASLWLADRIRNTTLLKWLTNAGKLSLTLYVAHVIFGMGTLEAFGLLEGQTIGVALVSALIFFLLGILFSNLWLKRFSSGPLEAIFRWAAR